MSESQLKAEVLLECSRDNTRLLRINSGRAWGGKILYQDGRKLILSPYHAISLAPEGTADIVGLVSDIITPEMVGQCVAIFAALELKYGRRKATIEQGNFITMVRRFGGRAGVARSVEEARRILGGEL